MDADTFLVDLRSWAETDLVFSAVQQEEARGNLCCLSLGSELAQHLSASAFVQALAFVRDRWAQRLADDGQREATFYAYLDRQASQLRFSLISGTDTALPFSCLVDDSASLQEIVTSFLDWPYLDGLPLSELREPLDEAGESTPVLRVYRAALCPRL